MNRNVNMTLFDAINATAAKTLDWNELGWSKVMVHSSVEVSWVDIANSGATNGNLKIYISNDTADTKATQTEVADYDITVGAGSKHLTINTPYRYLKLVYTDNTVTDGTITVTLSGERV